jgi:hypothetical protein
MHRFDKTNERRVFEDPGAMYAEQNEKQTGEQNESQ